MWGGGGGRGAKVLMIDILVKETEAHVLVRLRLWLGGLLRLLFLAFRGSSSSSGGSSSGESFGIGENFLDLFGKRESVLGFQGDRQHVLVAVDKRVGDRRSGREVSTERHSGDVTDTLEKSLVQVIVGDVEDFRPKDRSVGVHLFDHETVGEGENFQHAQESCFGGTDFFVLLDQVLLGQNFNRTLGNLGRNAQGLEERGLLGTHTSVLRLNEHIDRGSGAGLGRGLNLFSFELLTDVAQVFLGKDQTNVTNDRVVDLFQVGVGLDVLLEGTTHHSVLTHQNDGLAAQLSTDLVHLLRTNV